MEYEDSELDGKQATFEEAKKRRTRSIAADEDQRDKVVEDIRFALIEESQHDQKSREARRDRPKYEINNIIAALRQVIGQARQNRISLKVKPRTSGAREDIAETLTGMLRFIEQNSNFSHALDVATKEAFAGGYGAWQVITDEKDPEDFSGEQEIKIKAIHSASTSVWFDPSSAEEHHADAKFCFVDEQISREEYEERFGEKPTSNALESGAWMPFGDWQERDTVTVSDYWCKKPYKKKVALLSNGQKIELTKKTESVLDELAAQDVTVVEEKSIDSHKIVHYKMSGDKFLDGPNDWAGSMIPVIPLYGFDTWVEGQHYYSGIVRFAKDPQRLYNYLTSSKAEQAAVSLNNKLMATPQMAKGHERSWEDPNPQEILWFNPDARVPGGMPVKGTGAPVNNALVEQVYQSHQDIQRTTGVDLQSLGSNPRQQSGTALFAQQQRTDTGIFELMDNRARAVERSSKIIMDLVPRIYDTQRTEFILTEDGETQVAPINASVVDEDTGEVVMVNNLLQGTYDVIASAGPSLQTKRDETRETMAFIVQTAPELAPLAIPVLLENTDSPSARQMSAAMRMDLVRQGRIPPNEKEKAQLEEEQQAKAEAGPAPEEIQMQMQLKIVEAEARKAAAEAFKLELEIKRKERLMDEEEEQAQASIQETKSRTVKNMADAQSKTQISRSNV